MVGGKIDLHSLREAIRLRPATDSHPSPRDRYRGRIGPRAGAGGPRAHCRRQLLRPPDSHDTKTVFIPRSHQREAGRKFGNQIEVGGGKTANCSQIAAGTLEPHARHFEHSHRTGQRHGKREFEPARAGRRLRQVHEVAAAPHGPRRE